MRMFETLKELCNFHAISGDEQILADYITKKITPFVDSCEKDNLGNVIAFKKGEKNRGESVMYAAHMDEVGFLVTSVDESGLLKFAPVGGIDSGVVIGSRVEVGEQKLTGVIGNKPIHLLSPDERKTKVKFDQLYIDIGASCKKEAEKYVTLGDSVSFVNEEIFFGQDKIKAKALDNRLACAMLLEIAREPVAMDTYFLFSVQEEVGCVGAQVATQSKNPTYAVVVETTTAADNLGLDGAQRVCVLGEGPVISYMDNGTMYDRQFYRFVTELAEREKINWQTKTGVFGGNDGSVIHKANAGVKTIAISVPCRNLHTAATVADKKDIEKTLELVSLLTREELRF